LRFCDHVLEKTEKSQFLILPLDVPPPPLFTDDLEKSIIPQVPLFELLNKYDGVTEKASLARRALAYDPEPAPSHSRLPGCCSLTVVRRLCAC